MKTLVYNSLNTDFVSICLIAQQIETIWIWHENYDMCDAVHTFETFSIFLSKQHVFNHTTFYCVITVEIIATFAFL